MKGGASTDTDAQAFITAAAITDTTQKSAINTLVTNLKSANIWTKMKAIYPFVGGSASQHKFNLKDPRDLDAAYRLLFNGGWTHSSTGALPNGTTGYANTFLAPNAMGQNSIHISYYSRTNISGIYIDMGSEDSNSYAEFILSYNAGSGVSSYVYMNTLASDYILDSNPTTGLFIGNRTSNSTNILFRNNTKVINGIKSSLTPSTKNIYLGATNINGTAGLYSSRQQAFATIGDGLSDTEAANFYTAVQAYQTTLGRAV
jgi:hypothetical protein